MITINTVPQADFNAQLKFNEVDSNILYLNSASINLSDVKANISGGNYFIGDQNIAGTITTDKIISSIYQGNPKEPYGKITIPYNTTATIFEISSSLYSSIVLDTYVVSRMSSSYYAIQNVHITYNGNDLEQPVSISIVIPVSSPSASGDPTATPPVPPTFGKDSLIYSSSRVGTSIFVQVQNLTNVEDVIYTSIVRAFATLG
jgi:hypothetical protein